MDNTNELTFDPNEVQIHKPLTVESRVFNYLKRKREESNDRNIRVYYTSVSSSSSARTSSTITPKRQKGSECFVKNSKVVNSSGPLCNGGLDSASQNGYTLSNNENAHGCKSDVHERISNLEKCLNIVNNNHDYVDIYKKLKSIEDHVLKLENMLLINSSGKYSLSNICLNDDQPTEIINHNSLTDNNSMQDKLVVKKNLMNEDKSTASSVLSKKSKYTADEIQNLINSIKNNDSTTNSI